MSFILLVLLIIIDQISKYYIHTQFEIHQSLPLIKNILSVTYVRNYGASWGVLAGQRTIFIWITIMVIGYLLYLIYQSRSSPFYIKCWPIFILAGAMGNLIDRMIHGYVIDMIHLTFIDFPVFNFADLFLTIGFIGYIYFFIHLEQ